jgi:hypothetical protein
MKVMTVIFTVLAVVVGLCATPVNAQVPPLPHAFYGAVEINGDPAPVGTTVEVRGEGVVTGIEGNPITVTEAGKCGGPGDSDPKLVVQGDIEEGTILTFYVKRPTDVNFVAAQPTAEWHSKAITELNLSATITIPPGGGAPPTPPATPPAPPTPPTAPPTPPTPPTTPPASPTPPTTPPTPPTPPTAPPEVKPILNWPVIGGIIAGVVIVGLLIFFLVRRRA